MRNGAVDAMEQNTGGSGTPLEETCWVMVEDTDMPELQPVETVISTSELGDPPQLQLM